MYLYYFENNNCELEASGAQRTTYISRVVQSNSKRVEGRTMIMKSYLLDLIKMSQKVGAKDRRPSSSVRRAAAANWQSSEKSQHFKEKNNI